MNRPGWKSSIPLKSPPWSAFLPLLDELGGKSFPGPADLNRLLPEGLCNDAGKPLAFVPEAGIPGVSYEKHIYETGQISTRPGSWHDLFNALVWCCLPGLKRAMNAVHYRHLEDAGPHGRGPHRDALTLLDESGVIVHAEDPACLQVLAARDWNLAFRDHAARWGTDLQVTVCGHALLEKFLSPYKSLTAHALLVCTAKQGGELDAAVARLVRDNSAFTSPAVLSPLPLMGIPGWWRETPQNDGFYEDQGVFRLPRPGIAPAPVFHA